MKRERRAQIVHAAATVAAIFLLTSATASESTQDQEEKTSAAQAASAPGTCYRIVVERHPTLCKQWAQNLNLFCDQPPMVCDIKIHPSMRHLFSEPKWEQLDPVSNFQWVEAVYRAQGFVRLRLATAEQSQEWEDRNWKKMEEEVRRKAESGRLRLSRARFSPLNVLAYGSPMVYRVDDLDCQHNPADSRERPRPPSPLMAVIDESTGKVDYDRYETIHRGIYRAVLFRGGYTYLSNWYGLTSQGESLSEPISLNPLCVIDYRY